MASSSAKSQPPKPRKRVDVEPSTLKRATNGSAFTRCEHCNKDIPVAIADMHDCGSDVATKARLQENTANVVEESSKGPSKNSKEVTKKRERDPKKKLPKGNTKKPKQANKDPNMPKRPLSGFFLFMEDFRKTQKEENPSVKVGPAEVTKLGGARWKEMTDEEKAPYTKRAAELKLEYEAAMKKYKNGSTKVENETEDAGEAPDDGGGTEEVHDNIEEEDSS